MVIYQEIYLLTTSGFHNTLYIEALTPIERKIYWGMLIEEQKQREQASKGINKFDVTSPMVPKAVNTQDILNG